MTLDQAKTKIMEAIAAAEHRKEEALSYFNDEKNIQKLLFAIDYALNPPKATKRKVE